MKKLSDLMKDIKASLKEVKLSSEGKVKLKPARDLVGKNKNRGKL